jgi:hypothetical protein
MSMESMGMRPSEKKAEKPVDQKKEVIISGPIKEGDGIFNSESLDKVIQADTEHGAETKPIIKTTGATAHDDSTPTASTDAQGDNSSIPTDGRDKSPTPTSEQCAQPEATEQGLNNTDNMPQADPVGISDNCRAKNEFLRNKYLPDRKD